MELVDIADDVVQVFVITTTVLVQDSDGS